MCLPPDEDNVIPVYGFGDELTGDHSLFTFSETSDPKAGFPFEGIRSRYRQVVRNVTMAGPTSFAPIINQAVNIVSQTGEYHILVIIADGQVTRSVDIPPHAVSRNEKETIDAITYASNFPLSIIMVGVGDGPWESMIYFDNYLVHRRFDNFQFVEYHVRQSRTASPRLKIVEAGSNLSIVVPPSLPAQKIASRFPTPQMRETQFALQALMEIPDQYRVIKEMGYLGRGPGQLRSDMPRVEIFPSPLPPSPPAYHHSFNQYEESRPSQSNTPSAPTYSSSTVESSTVQGIPVAQAYQASATLNRQGSVAEAELARMQEELLCAICEDQRKNLVFQCGHETCERCGEFLDHCPICRQPIQVRIKRYG